VASGARADGPDISAQRLLDSWKGEDPGMRMVAEVIARAFASGLSWKGTLGGKEVYCPPQGLKGGQVITTLDQFLVSNPGRKILRRRDGGVAQPSVPMPDAIGQHDVNEHGSSGLEESNPDSL
jgi:hypothetical protein